MKGRSIVEKMVGTAETESCGFDICWMHWEQQIAKLEERVTISKMVWNIYGKGSELLQGVASSARTKQWNSWTSKMNSFILL